MSQQPVTLVILGIVWLFSVVGGVQFILNAFREQRLPRSASRLGKVYDEAKFRLRLAAGLALLLWVISGIIWIATHW